MMPDGRAPTAKVLIVGICIGPTGAGGSVAVSGGAPIMRAPTGFTETGVGGAVGEAVGDRMGIGITEGAESEGTPCPHADTAKATIPTTKTPGRNLILQSRSLRFRFFEPLVYNTTTRP